MRAAPYLVTHNMMYSTAVQYALRSWIYKEPRKQGGQQQHIKTSLSNTLTDGLHFETDQLNDWMLEPKKWANRIETALNLEPKT